MIAAIYLPVSSQTHNQPKAVDLGLSVLWSDTYLDAEMVNLANAGYYCCLLYTSDAADD